MTVSVDKILFFLIILNLSFTAHGDENSSLEKVVREITPITKEVNSIGKPLIISCNEFKESPQIDFPECKEAAELHDSIALNFKKDKNKYKSNLINLLETCFQKRFDKCYPNLNETIDLNQLNSLFNEWKKDSRFRYAAGFGMCAYRAEALSYHLAELGFKTKTISIGSSPSLIAMDRDINGNLNGNYDEYKGYHHLVQIMVNKNGKSIPYLLDPQYMDEPKPLKEYFIETTGQVCKKIKEGSQKSPIDLTNCYYSENSQNTAADVTARYKLFKKDKNKIDEEMLTCGWTDKELKLGYSIAPKWEQIIKKDTKINCTNAETPEVFKGKDVTLSTRSELILYAYENFADDLNKQIVSANEQIKLASEIPLNKMPENFQKDTIKRKESAIYSLKQLKNKIKLIKSNLKITGQD